MANIIDMEFYGEGEMGIRAPIASFISHVVNRGSPHFNRATALLYIGRVVSRTRHLIRHRSREVSTRGYFI